MPCLLCSSRFGHHDAVGRRGQQYNHRPSRGGGHEAVDPLARPLHSCQQKPRPSEPVCNHPGWAERRATQGLSRGYEHTSTSTKPHPDGLRKKRCLYLTCVLERSVRSEPCLQQMVNVERFSIPFHLVCHQHLFKRNGSNNAS